LKKAIFMVVAPNTLLLTADIRNTDAKVSLSKDYTILTERYQCGIILLKKEKVNGIL
jgi:hypothetical protein